MAGGDGRGRRRNVLRGPKNPWSVVKLGELPQHVLEAPHGAAHVRAGYTAAADEAGTQAHLASLQSQGPES